MYDSSWEKASRSSHPNLWSPPLVTPMSRGAMSEPDADSSREFPVQTAEPDRRSQRLPSVDEILFKIRHQDTFRPPHPQEVHYMTSSSSPPNYQVPISVPVPVPNPVPIQVQAPVQVQVQVQAQAQEQLNIAHWQHHAPLHNPGNYQFNPRAARFEQAPEEIGHETHGSTHFTGDTRPAVPTTTNRSPQQRNVPGTTAKKRGRKKKSDTICSHCQSTQTPEWRRGPDGSRTLCNACGLFYSKLTKKFGFDDANMIFAYKKRHNEVQDRIVPTVQQKNRYLSESLAAEK